MWILKLFKISATDFFLEGQAAVGRELQIIYEILFNFFFRNKLTIKHSNNVGQHLLYYFLRNKLTAKYIHFRLRVDYFVKVEIFLLKVCRKE